MGWQEREKAVCILVELKQCVILRVEVEHPCHMHMVKTEGCVLPSTFFSGADTSTPSGTHKHTAFAFDV